MGLHSPFDALFRTENFPVTSQPYARCLPAPCFPLLTGTSLLSFMVQRQILTSLFSPSVSLARTPESFLLSVKIRGVSLKVEDIAQKFEISRSTSWASWKQ